MPADVPGQKQPHDAAGEKPLSDAERPPGYLAGGGQMIASGPAEIEVSRWRQAFSAFHYPVYRMIWAGALVSNIGSWMQSIARDWLIYELSGGNAAWLGYNAFAEGLPLILLLPLGGVLSDRFSRRWLLVATNAASALLAIMLAGLTFTEVLRPWHILVITSLNACVDSVRVPANQALLPSLVDRADMGNAVAMNSIQFNLSRIAGPALGGLTLKLLGPVWSFGLNALSFAAVIVPLVRMPRSNRRRADEATVSMKSHLGEGLRYIAGRPDLLMMFLLIVIAGLFTAPVIKMLPALANQGFHGDESLFAMMLSGFGVGAVVGAVLLAMRSRNAPTPWRAFPVLMALGACEIVMGLTEQRWLAIVMIGFAGCMFVGTMARLNTAILYSTPDRFRGRTMSFHQISFRIGLPIGGLIAGGIAQSISIERAFWVFGVGMLLVVPVIFLLVRAVKVQYEPSDD